MKVLDVYSLIVTEHHKACRDFYMKWFGFEIVFEASWFAYLAAQGERPFGLALMSPDHPSQPPGSDAFDGRGLLITLQVEDAAREYARLRDAGLSMAHELRDEPWGQRRFAVIDPAGTWVDVVEQIEPAPDFWVNNG